MTLTNSTFLYSGQPTLIPKGYRDQYLNVFSENQWIDRHNCTRQVPMKVLALGFCRTGTVSMRRALMELGLPCYHFGNLFTSICDADMWIEAFESKYRNGKTILDRKFWDALLGHVSAIADFPAIAFAEELIAAYPEAKVIHWERNEDRWFESFEDGLIKRHRDPIAVAISYLDPLGAGRMRKLQNLQTECVFGAKNRTQLRQNCRYKYRDHNARVRRLLRDQPDRLLEYRLGQGWEPVCQLLCVKTPRKPFPHVNNKKAMEELKWPLMFKMVDRVFWNVTYTSLFFLLAYKLAKRLGLVAILAARVRRIREAARERFQEIMIDVLIKTYQLRRRLTGASGDDD